MRLRTISVVAAAALAVAGLSACRTSVGQAARIDGHQVSESQVNDYLTTKAKPISSSDGSSSIAPRPFVVDILIQERLYQKVLAAAPSGAPTKAQLTTLQHQYLSGKSVKATVEKLGAVGYSSSFDSKIIDVQVMGTLLNEEQQQGVDVNSIVEKIRFPVSVNPRYGTWNSKNLRFDAGPTAGLPSYLTLQSAGATGS